MYSPVTSTNRITVKRPSTYNAGNTTAANNPNPSCDCETNPMATSALDSESM